MIAIIHDYLAKSDKPEKVKGLINEALDILKSVGIPFEGKTPKALQGMGMCFLAVAGVTKSWKDAKGQNEHRYLKKREIITFINEHFEENISPGSYDDLRRKPLRHLVLADLILKSAGSPKATTIHPTRNYALSGDFKELITFYNTDQWAVKLKLFNKNKPPLEEILQRKRNLSKIPVVLRGGVKLELSQGGHNQLQREIIDEFLPRFAKGSVVLYIGDTSNKYLVREEEQLKALGFFELTHDSLPDIVAYDAAKNWLYLIVAFYSSGPMSEERILELKKSLKDCTAELIFITAFISKTDFKKNAADIGWESEVWTADHPDHMIHFNGDKFFGPYRES